MGFGRRRGTYCGIDRAFERQSEMSGELIVERWITPQEVSDSSQIFFSIHLKPFLLMGRLVLHLSKLREFSD